MPDRGEFQVIHQEAHLCEQIQGDGTCSHSECMCIIRRGLECKHYTPVEEEDECYTMI